MLSELFWSFVKIGIGAYGGGTATIQLIQHEIVEAHRWLTPQQMAEIVILAGMTPRPIAVNAATFTGYRVAGVVGAGVATLGVLIPAILFVGAFLLARRFSKAERWLVRLEGLVRPAVLALIAAAVWAVGRSAVNDWITGVFAAASFAILAATRERVHPALILLTFGLLGIFVP